MRDSLIAPEPMPKKPKKILLLIAVIITLFNQTLFLIFQVANFVDHHFTRAGVDHQVYFLTLSFAKVQIRQERLMLVVNFFSLLF